MNAASNSGETPLYAVCSNGLESIAKKMLECGAKVDVIDGKKLPLIAACTEGHASLVELLLANGANPNLEEDSEDRLCEFPYYRSLPLHIAAADGNNELVELLLKHDADVDVTDTDGNTALHHAIELHRHRTSLLPYSDNNDMSLGNKISVVDILLEKKADVNKLNKSGETPLYRAVSEGLLDVVNKMLQLYGGDPNKGSPDKIPLFVAVYKGYSDIIMPLLNAGADTSAVNAGGKNVVWFAVEAQIFNRSTKEFRKTLSTIRLLIQHGANFNVKLPNVDSPLSLALIVFVLVDDTVDTDSRHCAIELLQLMVKHGALLQDRDYEFLNSEILMALATFDGRHEFVADLLRAGAGFRWLASYCPGREPKSISLCQAAILAGYAPTIEELQQLQLEAARDDEESHLIQQLVNWLNEDRQQVPSLLRQCRVVIRRQLSVAAHFQSILPAIEQLDLLDIVREYLKFDGPLTEVDLNVKELQTS